MLWCTVSLVTAWCGWFNGMASIAPFVLAYATYEFAHRQHWRFLSIASATACMVTSRRCALGTGYFYWLNELLPSYFCLLQWSYMQEALIQSLVLGLTHLPYVQDTMNMLQNALQPPVGLTEVELERKAPLVYGRDCAHAGDHCAICYDELRAHSLHRHLPCQHMFHAACIDPWLLQRSAICPLCRVRLS